MTKAASTITIKNAILIDLDTLRFLKACPTVRQCEYWAKIKGGNTKIIGLARRYWAAFSFRELVQLYSNHCNMSATFSSTDLSPLIFTVVSLSQQMPVDDTPEAELEAMLGEKLAASYTVVEPEGSEIVSREDSAYRAPVVAGPRPPSGPAVIRREGMAASADAAAVAVGTAAAPPAAPAPAAKPPKAPKAPKAASEPKAPKEPGESKTGKVWVICDQLLAKHKGKIADNKAFRAELLALTDKEGMNQSTVSVQFGKWKKSKSL